jgi:hypothetical protein
VSGLSRPVRCLILWILRPAEVVAREFVADATQISWRALAEFPAIRCGDGSADAIRLALRFRALAAALDDLARQATSFARRRARIGHEPRRFALQSTGRHRVSTSDIRCPRGVRDVGMLLAEESCTALRVWQRKPNDTS